MQVITEISKISQKLLLNTDTVGLRFYKQPMFLYTNPKYQVLSPEARDLYMQLYNRLPLSKNNNWFDRSANGQKAYYVVYTLENMKDVLHKSVTKCIEIKHELSDLGLIYEKQTGYQQPNHIYLIDPEISEADYYDKQPINPPNISNSESHFKATDSSNLNNAQSQDSNSTVTSSNLSDSETKLDTPFDLSDYKDQKKKSSFNKLFWENAESIYSGRSKQGIDLSPQTIHILKLVYKTRSKLEKAVKLITSAKSHAIKQFFIENDPEYTDKSLMPNYRFIFDRIANGRLNSMLMRIFNKYKHNAVIDLNKYLYVSLVNEFKQIIYDQNEELDAVYANL